MNEPILKIITVVEARPHRQILLRPRQPPEAVIFAKDDDPESLHFAIAQDEKILAIASIMDEPFPLNGDLLSWRMRGVATYPHVRGHGYGTLLINACINHALSRGGKYIWCNARVVALGFYEANEFEKDGAPFIVSGAGLHYLMFKKLS